MDYRVVGEGLLVDGLTPDGSVVDAVGLMTKGFVFTCFSPFIPGPQVITTNWTTSPGITLTTWSGATGIIYGDC